jgi:hypothetical protein
MIDPIRKKFPDWSDEKLQSGPQFDAGMFYCPYIPLQMLTAKANETPKIGFKTRYGIIANPFEK